MLCYPILSYYGGITCLMLLVGQLVPGTAAKRVLEYGVRAPGFLRKSTGANERKRFSTNTYRKLVLFLQTSPKISANLREISGECNLGILHSSSLLSAPVSSIRG